MIIVLLVALVAVGWVALVSMDALIRRPAVAAWLVLGLVVIDALVESRVISVDIAGFRVSPTDIGFTLLVGAAVMRFLRLVGISPEQWGLVLLGVMSFLSLSLGVATGAVDMAVNDFRGYLGFMGSALYFSTVVPDLDTRMAVFRSWLWAGVGMAGIVALRWSGRLAGIDLGMFDASFDAVIRVINGPQTLFVASAALVLLLPGLERGETQYRRERQVGIVLLIMAILLNRRTVWIALAVVFLSLLVNNRRVGRRLAFIAVSGAILFTAALPFFSSGDTEAPTLAQSATDSATLTWRLEGWTELLKSGPATPADYVIGVPFGSGYARVVDGIEVESNPHSFYVQTFLRTGAIGLGALLLVLWLTFVALLQRRPGDGGPLSRSHLLLLLIMQIVLFLTWPPGAEQGIILGLAVATAVRDRRTLGATRPWQSTRLRRV